MVRVMGDNPRESDGWSPKRGKRVDLGKGLPDLRLRPAEGIREHEPELSLYGGTQKEIYDSGASQGQDGLAGSTEEDGRDIDIGVGNVPDPPCAFLRAARTPSSRRWRSASLLSPRRSAVSAPHWRSRCHRRGGRDCRGGSRGSSPRGGAA